MLSLLSVLFYESDIILLNLLPTPLVNKRVPHHDFVKGVSRCVCEIIMRKGCHL